MALTVEIKDLNKTLRKIGQNLNKAGQKLTGELDKVLFIGGNDIRNDIILSMVPGRRTTGPSGIIYKRGNISHQASAPGEAPAVDTGQLLRTILFEAGNNTLEVGSAGGAPYSEFLEDGTKNMEPRPFLQPAVDKNTKKITENIMLAGKGLIERAFDVKSQRSSDPDLKI